MLFPLCLLQLIPALQYQTPNAVTVHVLGQLKKHVWQLEPFVLEPGLLLLQSGCDLVAQHVVQDGALTRASVKWVLPERYLRNAHSRLVYKDEEDVAVVLRTERCSKQGARYLVTEELGLSRQGCEGSLLSWKEAEYKIEEPRREWSLAEAHDLLF